MAALESCLVLIPAVPAAEKTRIYHKVLNIINSTDITGGQGPSGPNWRSPLVGVITDVYFSPTASEDAVCDPDALDANIVFHRPEDAKYFVEIAKTEFSGMKLMETQVFNAVVAHVHPEVVATLQSRGILEATSQQMKHIGGIVIHNEPRFAIKGLMPQVFACGNVLQAALKTSATMKTESRVPSTPEEGDNRGRINDPNASFTEQSRRANVETSCAGRLYPEAAIRRAPPESQATRDSDMKTRAVDRAGTESSARTKPVVQDAQERVPARREASVKPPEDDATDKGGAFTTVYSRTWLHYDDKTNDDLKLSKQKFIESVGADMGPAEVHGRTAQPLEEEGRNGGKGVHMADGGKPIGESYEEENEGDTRVSNSAASAQKDEEYTDNSHGRERLSAPDDQRNEGKTVNVYDTKPDGSERDGKIHTREERGKPRHVDNTKPDRRERDDNIHTREERGKPRHVGDTKPDRSEGDGNILTREERGKPLCMDYTKPDRSERDGNILPREERGKPRHVDDTKPDRSEGDGNIGTGEGRGKPLCMDDTKPDRSKRDGNTHTREERGKPLYMDDTKPDRSERDGNMHTRDERGKPLYMDDTKPDRKRDGNIPTREERGKALYMDDAKPDRSERDGNIHTREERGKPHYMDDKKPDRSERDGYILTGEERGNSLHVDDRSKGDSNIVTRDEREEPRHGSDTKPDRTEGDESTGEEDQNAEENPHEQARSNREKGNQSVLGRDKRSPGPEYVHGDASSHAEGFVIADEATCGKETKKSTCDSSGAAILNFDDEHMSARLQRDRQNAELPVGTEETCSKSERATSDIELVKKRDDSDCMDQRVSEVNSGFVFGQANSSHEAEGPRDGEARGSGRGGTTLALDAALWSFMSVHNPGMKAKIDEVQAKCNVQLAEEMCASAGNLHITGENHKDVEAARRELTYLARECKTIELDVPMSKEEDLGEVQSKYPSVMLFWESSERVGVVGKVDLIDSQTHKISSDLRQEAEYVRRSQAGATTDSNLPSSSERRMVIGQDSSNLNPSAAMAQSVALEQQSDTSKGNSVYGHTATLSGDPALWHYMTRFSQSLSKGVKKLAVKHRIEINDGSDNGSPVISGTTQEDVDAGRRALESLYGGMSSSVQVKELEMEWPAHEDLNQVQAEFSKILLWRRASGKMCIVGKSDAIETRHGDILDSLKAFKPRSEESVKPLGHGESKGSFHEDKFVAKANMSLSVFQSQPFTGNSDDDVIVDGATRSTTMKESSQRKKGNHEERNAEQNSSLDLSDRDDDRHGVPSATSRRNPGRMSNHGESPCDEVTSPDADSHAAVTITTSLTREENADEDESGAQVMDKTRLPGDPALWMYITEFNKALRKRVEKIAGKHQIDIENDPEFASISAEVPEDVDAAGRALRDLYDSLASSVQVKELEVVWPAHEDLSQAQAKFPKILLWRRASGRVCIVGKSDAVDSACERILKQLKDDKRRHRLPERHHTEPILRDSAARGDGCHGSSRSQDHKGFPVDEYASNSARAVGGLHLEQERPSLANSHINTQHKMAYSMNAEQVGNLDLSDDDDDRHGVPSSTSRRNPGRTSSHGESPCVEATSADADSHAGVNINASLTREESADKDESGAQAMEKTRLPGDPALWMYITEFSKTLSKQVNKIGRKYQIDIEANPDFASISAEVPEGVDAAGRVLRDLYDSLASSVQVKELEMECPALETLIPVQAAFPKIMLWRRANGRVCIVGKNEAVDSECELILKELKDDKRRHRQPERHHTEPIFRDSAARGDGFHGLSQSQDHKGFPVDEYDGDRARSPRQTGERTGPVQSNDEEIDALCARTDALSLSESVSSFEVDRYYWQYLTNRQQKQLGKIEDKYSVKLTTHHDGLSDVIHVTGQDDVMVGKAKSELERTYTSVAYSLTTKKTKLDKRNTISIAQLKQDKNKLLINEEADGIIAITGLSDAVAECCKQINGERPSRSEQATGRQDVTETGIATDGGPGATSGHVPRGVSPAFNAREMGSTKFPKTYNTNRLGDNNGSYRSEAAGRRHDNSGTWERNPTSWRSDNKDAFPNPEGGIGDRQHGGQQPMPANVGAAGGGNRRNRKLKVSPAESEVSAYRSTDAGAGGRGRGRGFDSGRDSARSGGAGAGGHGGGGAPRCEPRGFRVATGTVILVHMADITKMSVEVIVNAANDRLEHIGGLALAIARGAGIRLEDESRQYIRQHGAMQTSQCIATTAGNLPCRQVLHAVGPMWNARPDNQSFNLLKATFSNILTLAYAMGIDSIAVPAVSSGIYGAPLEAVAAAIVQSVYTTELQYQNRPNPISLKEVHFVDISPRTVGIIQRAFDDVLRGRDSPWRSVDEAEVRRSIDARFAGGPFRSGQAAAGRRPDGEQPQERTQPQTTVNVDGWGDGASVPRSRQKQALRQGDPAADNKQEAECSICCSEITNRKVLEKCKHAFCAPCIDTWFAQKPTCPVCGQAYGAVTGNQPDGTMNWSSHYVNLPGYPGCGTIVIEYQFPSGIQTAAHPSPGKPYTGTSRTAYLPDNAQGRQVLRLLKMAFEAKLTFTIGTSVTTGANNTVTWNDIHHKTSNGNYGIEYGYPDPRYLDRVTEELAAKGIK